MRTIGMLKTLFVLTLVSSATFGRTENMQLSCKNKNPIGTGKIEISGRIEVDVTVKSGTVFKHGYLAICDEGTRGTCQYEWLTVNSGRYLFNGQFHEVTLNTLNPQNNHKLNFKLAVLPRSTSIDTWYSQSVPEDSFSNISTSQTAPLICNPTDLNPNATVPEMIKKFPELIIGIIAH